MKLQIVRPLDALQGEKLKPKEIPKLFHLDHLSRACLLCPSKGLQVGGSIFPQYLPQSDTNVRRWWVSGTCEPLLLRRGERSFSLQPRRSL